MRPQIEIGGYGEMNDISDRIAADARALFANLPTGEVSDSEPLLATLERNGLAVIVQRNGWLYQLFRGVTVRVRAVGGQAELTAWRRGRMVEMETRPLAGLSAWLGNAKPNA